MVFYDGITYFIGGPRNYKKYLFSLVLPGTFLTHNTFNRQKLEFQQWHEQAINFE